MSSERARRTVVEHNQKELEKQTQKSAEERIDALIKDGAALLKLGGDVDDPRDISAYAELSDTTQNLIEKLEVAGGEEILELATDVTVTDEDDAIMAVKGEGIDVTTPKARETLETAFEACASIAGNVEAVDYDKENRADMHGLAVKLGEQLKGWDNDFGDTVRGIVDDRKGTVKSLYSGGTGAGKSSGANRQFEDYYRKNFQEGADCKCIDVVDFTSGENIFYDVPQQQGDLRRILSREMGLSKDFTDIEGYEPEMEVLVPLTPNLSEMEIPYDTEKEEFLPRYFTIAASDISQDLITKYLGARLSQGEENTIRDVYETVDREQSAWSLKDLAREIVSRDELSDKHKKQAVRALRSLQDMGFIREDAAGDSVDWAGVFRDTQRITVFSQSLCSDETTSLFVLAWILDKMWELRSVPHSFPEMAVRLWEMWEYVPHGRRESDTETQAALQERIAYLITRMFRKNRDVQSHFIGDTQEIMDLHIGIRKNFNRYVVYEGNDTVFENVFSWTSNSKWRSFKETITENGGEAGIVGLTGPSSKPGIEYLSPVKMAPTTWHHHDKGEGNGWIRRVDLVEEEELRKPEEWPTAIPEGLKIGSIEEYQNDISGSMTTTNPKEFHKHEAINRARNGETIRQIRDEIPNNPDTGKPYSTQTIWKWTNSVNGTQEPEAAD